MQRSHPAAGGEESLLGLINLARLRSKRALEHGAVLREQRLRAREHGGAEEPEPGRFHHRAQHAGRPDQDSRREVAQSRNPLLERLRDVEIVKPAAHVRIQPVVVLQQESDIAAHHLRPFKTARQDGSDPALPLALGGDEDAGFARGSARKAEAEPGVRRDAPLQLTPRQFTGLLQRQAERVELLESLEEIPFRHHRVARWRAPPRTRPSLPPFGCANARRIAALPGIRERLNRFHAV